MVQLLKTANKDDDLQSCIDSLSAFEITFTLVVPEFFHRLRTLNFKRRSKNNILLVDAFRNLKKTAGIFLLPTDDRLPKKPRASLRSHACTNIWGCFIVTRRATLVVSEGSIPEIATQHIGHSTNAEDATGC